MLIVIDSRSYSDKSGVYAGTENCLSHHMYLEPTAGSSNMYAFISNELHAYAQSRDGTDSGTKEQTYASPYSVFSAGNGLEEKFSAYDIGTYIDGPFYQETDEIQVAQSKEVNAIHDNQCQDAVYDNPVHSVTYDNCAKERSQVQERFYDNQGQDAVYDNPAHEIAHDSLNIESTSDIQCQTESNLAYNFPNANTNTGDVCTHVNEEEEDGGYIVTEATCRASIGDL